MLSEYKCMQNYKQEDKANKRLVGMVEEKLNEAKVKEAHARQPYQEMQNKLASMTLVKEQKSLGLLTNKKFIEEYREAFGM